MKKETWDKKIETWYVDKVKVILPTDLKKNPDKHGGLGLHMRAAINEGVISIPLVDNPSLGAGSHISLKTTDVNVAERLVNDGMVDIHSDGSYWLQLGDKAKPYFHGTDEVIEVWKGGLFAR